MLRTYGRLLRDWRYLGYVLAGGLVFAGLLAYIAGSPFIFIELYGISPQRFGLFFGSNAIGIIAASQVNRFLVHRYSARQILQAVLWITLTASVGLLLGAYTNYAGLAGIVVPLWFFVAMHGIVSPNTTALAMSPYGAVAGSASALLGTVQFLLGAAAGSLIGAFADGTASSVRHGSRRLRVRSRGAVPPDEKVKGAGAKGSFPCPLLQRRDDPRQGEWTQQRRDRDDAGDEVGCHFVLQREDRRDDGGWHRRLNDRGLKRCAFQSEQPRECPTKQRRDEYATARPPSPPPTRAPAEWRAPAACRARGSSTAGRRR